MKTMSSLTPVFIHIKSEERSTSNPVSTKARLVENQAPDSSSADILIYRNRKFEAFQIYF